MDLDIKILKPGDCLLYRPSSFFGYLIAIKTWNKVSHTEVYIGHGRSVASRDGIGVDEYPLRLDGLAYVLRPNQEFNLQKGLRWFYKYAKGQKYDWKGMLVFALAVRQGALDKMFCSECSTRLYRKCDLKPFSNNYNADRVAPATFLCSPTFDEIWRDGD